MYKENLALNNLQGLIYHKVQPTKIACYSYIDKANCINNFE